MKVINIPKDTIEKENKLFNRKEIQINIEAEITPSHEEAKELISEKFSTQPEYMLRRHDKRGRFLLVEGCLTVPQTG